MFMLEEEKKTLDYRWSALRDKKWTLHNVLEMFEDANTLDEFHARVKLLSQYADSVDAELTAIGDRLSTVRALLETTEAKA